MRRNQPKRARSRVKSKHRINSLPVCSVVRLHPKWDRTMQKITSELILLEETVCDLGFCIVWVWLDTFPATKGCR